RVGPIEEVRNHARGPEIGPARADQDAAVAGRSDDREITVVVQERVDVGRLLEILAVVPLELDGREVVRRAEGGHGDVDLGAAAGDPGAGTHAATLGADQLRQTGGQAAR